MNTPVKRPVNSFVNTIGWQLMVLMTVVYATVEANVIAAYMISGYGGLAVIFGIVFGFLLTVPVNSLISDQRLRFCLPTKDKLSTASTFICRVVSFIEITLFVQYEFYWLAVVWLVVEILQYAAMRRVIAADRSANELVVALDEVKGLGKSMKSLVLESALLVLEKEMDNTRESKGAAKGQLFLAMQTRYNALSIQYITEVIKENENK